MSGWTGAGVRQAGGTCAIAVVTYAGDSGPESGTGFLMTPLGNYAGDLTMTFRARLWTTEEGTDQMAVMIVSKEVGVLEDKKIQAGTTGACNAPLRDQFLQTGLHHDRNFGQHPIPH